MNTEKTIKIIRWIARIWSLFSLAMFLLFSVGESLGQPLQFTPQELLGLLFFPVGVALGMVLAWKWELPGGLITAGSLLAFYLLEFIIDRDFPSGIWFLLFAAPGFLFLLTWYLSSRGEKTG